MARTTITHVRAVFRRATAAAEAAGLNVTGWYFEGGSKINGVTWKLHTHNEECTSVELSGWGRNFLGWTAQEAYDTLLALAGAWEAVARVRDSVPAA
ncbi:hypothetical protein AB0M43_23905 [Longispora sp. NPDC051575]|uniref:hypothetical protein n=1 Tax=Longispora sp. NPDC051575 TaxID=3154943 RepID=UPI0034490F8A